MTLHAIVAALGGELYQGGRRANVPASGHSADDRSISLLLDEGRVVIHGFGAAGWREMRDALRRRGFIDTDGRLTGASAAAPSTPRQDPRIRTETARGLWNGAVALTFDDPATRYLTRRAVSGGQGAHNLRLHTAAPVAVYRAGGPVRPALVARVADADDRLTAVEIAYLTPNGGAAAGLRLARKTVGVVPAGAAVRLSPIAEAMLVGEGVVTVLSAMERFGLPGWSLMSANNLSRWSPPDEVRRVLIAADRGRAGEGAADKLLQRLRSLGLEARIRLPDPPFGDWNEAARAARKRGEGGR